MPRARGTNETGRIRGLLCQPCNFAIGQLDDDEDRMQRMIDYVRRNRLHVVEGGD